MEGISTMDRDCTSSVIFYSFSVNQWVLSMFNRNLPSNPKIHFGFQETQIHSQNCFIYVTYRASNCSRLVSFQLPASFCTGVLVYWWLLWCFEILFSGLYKKKCADVSINPSCDASSEHFLAKKVLNHHIQQALWSNKHSHILVQKGQGLRIL